MKIYIGEKQNCGNLLEIYYDVYNIVFLYIYCAVDSECWTRRQFFLKSDKIIY